MQDKIYKTPAVVLRRYDFGETGRQLVIYTQSFGKLSAIAKGVKRATSKLAGHLEPMCLTSIVAAQGRNLDTITQATTIEAFANARTEPERVIYALLAAELLDKLTPEREMNRAVWNLFIDTLRRLDTEANVWAPTMYFWIRMLILSGYRPELYKCVECEASLDPSEIYFGPTSGGTLCAACRGSDYSAFRITAQAVKVLRVAANEPYDTFRRIRKPATLRSEIEDVLKTTTSALFDQEIRAPALIDAFRRNAPVHPAAP